VGIFNPEGLCGGEAGLEIGEMGIVQMLDDDEEIVQLVIADMETCRMFSEDGCCCCGDECSSGCGENDGEK
jgi:hypothetical protein